MRFLLLPALLIGTLLFAGCENEGPAERAGERIDEAAEDFGNAVEDACEDMKEKAGTKDQDC